MDMCAKGKNYNDRSSGPVNMVNDISNLNNYITTLNAYYNSLAYWVWREESRKKNAFIVKNLQRIAYVWKQWHLSFYLKDHMLLCLFNKF